MAPELQPARSEEANALKKALRLIEVMEDSHSRPLAKSLIDACSEALETTSEELLVKALETAQKALSLVVGRFSYHVALSKIEIEQKGMCLAEIIEELKGKVVSKDALQKATAQRNQAILETIAA